MNNMEYNPKTDNLNPLLCFQYQINPVLENKLNLLANYNTFLPKISKKYPSLKQLKKKEQKTEDYDDYIKLDAKRNYEETDLFSMQNIGKILMMKRKLPLPQPMQKHQSPERDNIIRNNLNLPNDHTLSNINGNDNHNEATIDFFPNMIPKTNDILPSLPDKEDIDKLIVLFPQLSDIKTKGQTIKKFIAYYKKNKYDELKITSFFMSLSSQINESSSETKSWILYEYLKTRLESTLTSICKEMVKLITFLQTNNININNGDIPHSGVQAMRKIVSAKIKDFLIAANEEEETITSKPFIIRFIENYNPNKGKKKEIGGFYKEKLNKKIRELFEKNHMQISEEKIALWFYPQLASSEIEDNNNNNHSQTHMNNTNNDMLLYSLNDKNSFNNSLDNSSHILDEEKNILHSHNSNINLYNKNNISKEGTSDNRNSILLKIPQNYLNSQIIPNLGYQKKILPKFGTRFKVKQYSENDF